MHKIFGALMAYFTVLAKPALNCCDKPALLSSHYYTSGLKLPTAIASIYTTVLVTKSTSRLVLIDSKQTKSGDKRDTNPRQITLDVVANSYILQVV